RRRSASSVVRTKRGSDVRMTPWYRRPLLPRWMPTWLVLSLATASAIGYVATYAPRDPRDAGLAFCIGFGGGFLFGVCIAGDPRMRRHPGWAVPLWVSLPIQVALMVGLGASYVIFRDVGDRWGKFLDGPAAVAYGLMWILVGGIISFRALSR